MVSQHGYGSSVALHGNLVLVAGENKGEYPGGGDKLPGCFPAAGWFACLAQSSDRWPPVTAPLSWRTSADDLELFLDGAENLKRPLDPSTGRLLWESPRPWVDPPRPSRSARTWFSPAEHNPPRGSSPFERQAEGTENAARGVEPCRHRSTKGGSICSRTSGSCRASTRPRGKNYGRNIFTILGGLANPGWRKDLAPLQREGRDLRRRRRATGPCPTTNSTTVSSPVPPPSGTKLYLQ